MVVVAAVLVAAVHIVDVVIVRDAFVAAILTMLVLSHRMFGTQMLNVHSFPRDLSV